MTTRKAVQTKKTVELTASNYRRVDVDEGFYETGCCGLVQYEGLDSLITVEDAVAVRRLASPECPVLEAEDGYGSVECPGNTTAGAVICISSARQTKAPALLRGAGFKDVFTFRNGPNGSVLTLWIAPVLRLDKLVEGEKELDKEVVIL